MQRRAFLAGALTTGVAVATPAWLTGATPAWARPGRVGALDAVEAATLDAWCELLVPGAASAGAARFVGGELARPHEEARLMLRLVTWPPPYDGFYRSGLASLEAAARSRHRRSFAELTAAQRQAIRDELVAGTLPWDGPPLPLFTFVTRGDAVDVAYGTPAGFDRIAFPYQPLVEPRRLF